MSKPPSRKTKLSRRMGVGTGKNYRPYITTSEFNSLGTTAVIPDWKTGRGVHCLSQAEAYWYYILRWDDTNVDIREQFPLDRGITEDICKKNGFKHPGNSSDYVMTTDFLVTKDDGSFVAYSIKHDRDLSERTLQILCIEKIYWLNKGVDYKILFKEDINLMLVKNIRDVVGFYDENKVFDDYSRVKHLIAIKELAWNMENIPINNQTILNEVNMHE